MRFLAAVFGLCCASVIAAEGTGTPVEVSCGRASSFEKTLRVVRNHDVFAAGWAGSPRRPVVARIAGGVLRWCREDMDTSGKSTVTGMIVSDSVLFVAFSIPAENSAVFEAFTAEGWLRKGGRGSASVTVLLKLNAESGQSVAGTFISASADNGSSAAFRLKSMRWDGENLRLTGLAGWQPRMKNRVPMTCTGQGPFETTMLIAPDLRSVLDAKADRCVCCE